MTPNRNRVLLSLGSNKGDKKKTLLSACSSFIENNILNDIVLSSFYETEPVGVQNQNWFINAAFMGFTDSRPLELLSKTQQIEKQYGRHSKGTYQERTLDIDIILYGNIIIESPELKIPHPAFHLRKFVLIPAAEIAGEVVPAGFDENISKILENLNDDSIVKKID